MKKPWDSFEKNYVAVETVDPRTGKPKLQYEYCGPWFLCCARPEIWRKAKLVSAGSLAADVAAVFWSGLMDSALNRAAATCVPFGLSVAALLFVVLGTGMFLASGMKMKRPDYERMDRLLRSAPVIEAILLFLASVLGIIYAFINII